MKLTARHPVGPGTPGEPPGAAATSDLVAVTGDGRERRTDAVVVEEPMEIRVVAEEEGRRRVWPVAVTMRTPGHDLELAVGFLFSEGAVAAPGEIWRVGHCSGEEGPNVVEVVLAPEVRFDAGRFSRNVYTTSSCGICGRASLDLVESACDRLPRGDFRMGVGKVRALPRRLRGDQALFSRTGGLHAAALFAPDGTLLGVREDVGRHNALDKLIGRLLLDGALPADDTALLVSGRASFELVQKAVLAGIPLLAAVGAPSSLAVELAARYGMTLIGFLRDDRFNVYAGEERLGP